MALFGLPLVNNLARDLGTLCKSRAIWHWTTRLLCKENSTYCCYLCSRSQAGRMLSLCRAEMTLFSAICICVFLVKYHSFHSYSMIQKVFTPQKNVRKIGRIHASNTWKMLRSTMCLSLSNVVTCEVKMDIPSIPKILEKGEKIVLFV